MNNFKVNTKENMLGFGNDGYKFGSYCLITFTFSGKKYSNIIGRIEFAYPNEKLYGNRMNTIDLSFSSNDKVSYMDKRFLIKPENIESISPCDVDGFPKPGTFFIEPIEDEEDIENLTNKDSDLSDEFDNDAIEKLLAEQQLESKQKFEMEQTILNNNDQMNSYINESINDVSTIRKPIDDNLYGNLPNKITQNDNQNIRTFTTDKTIQDFDLSYLDEDDDDEEDGVVTIKVLKFKKQKYYTNNLVKIKYENEEGKEIEDIGRIDDILEDEIILDCSKRYKKKIKNINVEDIIDILILRK